MRPTTTMHLNHTMDKKHTICCIGHITLDIIVTPRHTVHMPGGTAFYFAHGMAHLDPKGFLLVTSLAPSEIKAVDDIRSEGVEVKVLPSPTSVCFENKYGEDQNNRTQRVLAKANPFTIEGLKDVDAKYYHLGTLLADDFSVDVIHYLSTKGIVSVDAQGYLREVRGEDVFAVDWPEKVEAMKYIDILKANEKEMETLTGSTDPHEAAKILAGWGVKEVLLTLGSYGSLIYAEGVFYDIPAYPPVDVVDATGCGDTYMTGYLYKRNQGADYLEAGKFAAAMCTLKLAASGPFSASEAAVDAIIQHTGATGKR